MERHASLSYIRALYNAADRDLEIIMLEKRLLDSRLSVLVSGSPRYYNAVAHSESSATTGHRCLSGSEHMLHIYYSTSSSRGFQLQAIIRTVNSTHAVVVDQCAPVIEDDPDACIVNVIHGHERLMQIASRYSSIHVLTFPFLRLLVNIPSIYLSTATRPRLS